MSFERKNLIACTPSTNRGTPLQLGSDPKNEWFTYTNGKTVIIRNFKNPSLSKEYTQHTSAATVAKFSPSGFYIASGDVAGNVRIWDSTQDTQILKYESKVISGRINDIAWDSESKRIIAVGDGKERYGHAFLYDSGSSVGEISGHNKVINACAIRQNRPFRAATCSDDFTVNFYHGPPFKFNLSISDHTRFVQSVEFSPSGAHLATAGADGKIFLYDGTTGAKVKEITLSEGHDGGIFAISWSPDSTKLLSSSGDMTVKLWDIETSKAITTFKTSSSPTVDDQQIGNLWAGDHILSVSLSGDINYLSTTSETPTRILKGHSKGITSIVKANDTTFFTGSYDGRIYEWSSTYETGTPLKGDGHSNQIVGMSNNGKAKIYTTAMDDTLKAFSVESKEFDPSISLPTSGMPKSIATSPKNPEVTFLSTNQSILVFKDKSQVHANSNLSYQATSLSVSPDGKTLAVGGEDNKVHLYEIDDKFNLTEKGTIEGNRGQITSVAFSPDGELIAVADTQRAINVYEVKTKQLKIHQWVFHNARVNCFAWSPNGKYAVSGSLDTNIIVWSVEKPMKKITIKGAHQESVTGVTFLNDNTVVSTGQDACIRIWKVEYAAEPAK